MREEGYLDVRSEEDWGFGVGGGSSNINDDIAAISDGMRD